MRSPFPIWVHELASCIVNKNSISGKSSLSVLGKSKRRFQQWTNTKSLSLLCSNLFLLFV
ncbi:hypothetical protein LINPERPRIM_LOCUS4060 [Linum perenne]